MVSFARFQPLYKMNRATPRPIQPSTGMPDHFSIKAATKTAPVVMQSLRLSAAVARSVVESMRLARFRLNRFIQNFTAMEATSTAAAVRVKLTGVGWKILSTEVFTSSTPMTTIKAATPSPLRYSARA